MNRKQSWQEPIEHELGLINEIIDSTISDDNSQINEMMRAAVYPLGKMIRPSICVLSYYACGGQDKDKIARFAAASELLHTATLIHDDINDHSEYRRGKLCLYKQYGVRKSLIIGDMLLIKAIGLIKNCLEPFVSSTTLFASDLASSEFEQFNNQHNTDISEKEYFHIISGKTAIFISNCAKSGPILANAPVSQIEAMESFGMQYGIGFQVVDDLIDITGSLEQSGKTVQNDMEKGTITLPVIIAMKDPQIGEDVRHMIDSSDDLDRIIEKIKETDAIEQCNGIIRQYSESAKDALMMIPRSIFRDALEMLVDESMQRNN